MTNPIKLLCGVAFASIVLSQAGFAQDAGLYDNAIDPTKAYVRVLLLDGDQASIGGSPVVLPDERVSGYVSVAAGVVDVGMGEDAMAMTVEAGTYYTFAQADDGMVQFIDPAITDPSKAEVLFYNLTDQAGVDLFVPAAKTNAITGVDAGTSQSVELRAPLSLTFEAQVAGATIASATEVALVRKQAVSLFLTETADGPALVQVVNSFADTK